MSFTNVFGGSVVRPSQPSYLELEISEDTELFWPLETTAGSPVVAAMLDVTATTTGLEVMMPPGDTGSTGVVTMITNVGSNTFTVTDQSGATIIAIPTTQSWLIALTDNSDSDGTWRALQMASTTSSATAAALAGPGLKAVGPLLELNYVPEVRTGDLLITASYRAKAIEWDGSIDGQFQLDTLANLTPGWSVLISNPSDFVVYLTTSGGNTINNLPGIDIKAGQSVLVVASSTQFLAFGVLLGVLPLTEGGTGAATAGQALINLGGTSLGISIFTAPSAASVIALLGLNNFTFRESTVNTNQSVSSSAGNTAYVATAALTATLPLTTTVDTSFVVSFYAQGGAVTITPQATEAINGGTAGVSFVLPQGASILLTTDGAGAWWPFFLTATTGASWVAAGGTNDAITATYSPAIGALTDGLLLGFRASGPNNTTTPTFAPNGLTARTITKYGGVALALGDIPNANAEVLIRYNLANTRWELLNPAGQISDWAVAGGTVNAITAPVVLAALGGLYDGLLVGFRASGANTSTTPTLNVNSIGALTITRTGGAALLPGDIPAALAEVLVRYNLANTRWELLNPANAVQNWAAAAGTVDAITMTAAEAAGGLYDGLLLGFRATGANTSTAPTLAPNGFTAHPITRAGGSALVAGDIPAANAECMVRYNLANTRWELLNPAVGLQPGGYYLQTGTATITLGSGSVTYPTAFPNETKAGGVSLTIAGGSATASFHAPIVGTTTAAGFAMWSDATETVTVNWQAWGR